MVYLDAGPSFCLQKFQQPPWHCIGILIFDGAFEIGYGPMPGERSIDHRYTLSQFESFEELLPGTEASPGFQIGVTKTSQFGVILFKIEDIRHNPQYNQDSEERMGHATVTPIEEAIMAIAYEDIGVVKVTMIQCLGQPIRAEFFTHLGISRDERQQASVIGGAKSILLAYQECLGIVEKLCIERRQLAQTPVEYPQCQEIIQTIAQIDLEFGVRP